MATKEEVCARIKEIGILPAIRVLSAEDALFAAGQMFQWGIPIVELTMTVPGAIGVITELARTHPGLIVGAGTVVDLETARACVDAGAAFISSPGLDPKIVEYTVRRNVAAIPGALSPTEVMMAHNAGADLIKIFPCAAVGGPSYIKALKAPFPHVQFIASGGVNQTTATGYIRACVAALRNRGEIITPEAIDRRDQNWIHELAGRFLAIVQRAQAEFGTT